MREGFSEECLICKLQTLPCPPAPTASPALQLGGDTSVAQHHSSHPAVAGTSHLSLPAPPDVGFLITLQFKDPPETKGGLLFLAALFPKLRGLRKAQVHRQQLPLHWALLCTGPQVTRDIQGAKTRPLPAFPPVRCRTQGSSSPTEQGRGWDSALERCGTLCSSRKLQEKES